MCALPKEERSTLNQLTKIAPENMTQDQKLLLDILKLKTETKKLMTNLEAREVFNAAILEAKTEEQKDKIEMIREYFCNPEFRIALGDFVFEFTQEKK